MIEDFTQVIQLNPNNAWVYDCRGNAYERIGETEKADADFEKSRWDFLF